MWIQELWSEVPNELIPFPRIHRFFSASSYRRLFVPAALSKVAELDSQSFFGEILPPSAGVEISPKPFRAWNFAIPICVLPLPLEQSNIRRQEDKMRWFGKRITYHWLLLRSYSQKRISLTGLIRECIRKRTQRNSGQDKEMGCHHLQYWMPLWLPVCKWGQPFSLVRHQSGVFHSLLSILHTDKAMELARRHKSLLRRMDVLFGIRGVV